MLRSTLNHLTLVSDHAEGLRARHSDAGEKLWLRLRQEAELAVVKEPMLARLFFDSIINQSCFEDAVFHRIAARLPTTSPRSV